MSQIKQDEEELDFIQKNFDVALDQYNHIKFSKKYEKKKEELLQAFGRMTFWKDELLRNHKKNLKK